MRKIIGNTVAAALLAVAINSAPVSVGALDGVFGTSVAEAGKRCRKSDNECNKATGGRTYRGTDHNPNEIQVTVCHGYWDQLDVGFYKGQRTKWWEPVIVKGNWKSTPLPTITQRCKTMWRRPGEQIGVYADCVKRKIWTPPVTVSGKTYTMY